MAARTTIPDPLIITDTREQKPFVFTCKTVARKLDTGDYSIDGLTHRVAIERKGLQDFINSVTNDRARFMREVKRMAEMRKAHREDGGHLVTIVIEGSIRDVELAADLGGSTFNSIFATAASLHASWGIPVIFAGDRWMATRYTEELLKKFNTTSVRRGLSRT